MAGDNEFRNEGENSEKINTDIKSFTEMPQNTSDEEKLNKPTSVNTPSPLTNVSKDTLITTAVHFLQNPKVNNVSLSQKRAFLIKKGLSNSDIDQAFERAGLTNSGHLGEQFNPINHEIVQRRPNYVPLPHGSLAVYQSPSLWTRWRELCSSLMVIGATCYGVYYVFKQYIEPLIIGKKRNEEDRMTKIERHLMELNRSLSQLRHSLVCVESALSKQKDIDLPSTGLSDASIGNGVGYIHDVSDLKAEVASIKSLLLSRKQFPVAPTTSLSIPTWQLKEQEDASRETESPESLEANNEKSEMEEKNDSKIVPNGIAINGDLETH